jgi:enamine deaminase RidA (YjgF/YER057c/UK114 family)
MNKRPQGYATSDQALLASVPSAPPESAHDAVDQVVRDGRRAYVSGQVAFDGALPPLAGKVGREVSVEEAAGQARLAAANALHRLRRALGTLEEVERVLKLSVFVNAVDDCTSHPAVADGASSILVEVLGDAGRHARAAVGVASLPLGVPVEVELLVRTK